MVFDVWHNGNSRILSCRMTLRIEIAFPFFQSQRNRQSERRVYEGFCLLEKKWKTKSVDGAGRVLLVVADAGAILFKLDLCPERWKVSVAPHKQ